MSRWFTPVFAAALCLSAPAAFAQSPDFAAAVAMADRPGDAIALDESRRPAEVLAFLGLKRGDRVADVMAGTGYYTEIMAHAVGPKGSVIAIEPKQFVDEKTLASWDQLRARVPNAEVRVGDFGTLSLADASLDFTLLHLVYHDLYWTSEKYKVPRVEPAAFLASLFAATRPGGIVGVVDHVGPAGDTRAIVEKLHRIDPAVIKADFAAAGFVLEAESALLRMPGDDTGKLVFDPSVRGKTDRVVYRFRKPG